MRNGFFKNISDIKKQNKKRPIRVVSYFKIFFRVSFLFQFFLLVLLLNNIFISAVLASPDCHADGLAKFGITNPKGSADTFFFPGLHSNSGISDNKYYSLFSICAPLFYQLSEKYNLYPADAPLQLNNDINLQKYIAKAPNVNFKFVLTCLISHFTHQFDFAFYDIFSNFIFSYPLNKKLHSELMTGKLPLAVSILDFNFEYKHYLIYNFIDCGDYEVYLVNDPFSAARGYNDMYSKILCYDKNNMDFKVFESAAKKNTVRRLMFFVLHPVSWYFKSADQFEKLREGVFGIENAYDYLKLLIEKKIVNESAQLKKYRLYNFLPPSRQSALLNLILAVKKAIIEPELAPYVNTFDSSLNSLQVNMAQKNKIAQEKLVLKRFNAFDGNFEKLKIDLTPRNEFDFIFRKVPFKN